jgi:hypothetical protein
MEDNDVEWAHDCYWTDEPSSPKKRGPWSTYMNVLYMKDPKKKVILDEGHFFLFPRKMPGFVLKTRQWRKSLGSPLYFMLLTAASMENLESFGKC